jgi:hypothetical protein
MHVYWLFGMYIMHMYVSHGSGIALLVQKHHKIVKLSVPCKRPRQKSPQGSPEVLLPLLGAHSAAGRRVASGLYKIKVSESGANRGQYMAEAAFLERYDAVIPGVLTVAGTPGATANTVT